jgi:RNA polymerase sigma factor (sigma-70 family)
MFTPKDFLLANLPLIKGLVVSIGRQARMSTDDIEDLSAQVQFKLIENDYAIIRAFRNRSSFKTFIGVVIGRILLDERIHQRGKWHPSAAAEGLGELAVTVERLLYRDERSRDEAFAALGAEHPHVTRAEFDELVARVPARTRRRNVPIDNELTCLAAPSDAMPPERAEMAAKISGIVRKAIAGMANDDQTLLWLRFESAMNVAEIARALHLNQQALYLRFRELLAALRGELQSAGITASDVTDLIGEDTELLEFWLKSPEDRPSK